MPGQWRRPFRRVHRPRLTFCMNGCKGLSMHESQDDTSKAAVDMPKRWRSKALGDRLERHAGLVFIAPAVFAVLFLIGYPLIWNLYMSLQKWELGSRPPRVHWPCKLHHGAVGPQVSSGRRQDVVLLGPCHSDTYSPGIGGRARLQPTVLRARVSAVRLRFANDGDTRRRRAYLAIDVPSRVRRAELFPELGQSTAQLMGCLVQDCYPKRRTGGVVSSNSVCRTRHTWGAGSLAS